MGFNYRIKFVLKGHLRGFTHKGQLTHHVEDCSASQNCCIRSYMTLEAAF